MKDWLIRFVALWLAPILRFIFKYDLRGLDNLPRTGPFIVASNHISYLDPIVLIHVGVRFRKPRWYLRFLSKQELFEKQPMRFVMRSSKMIPVDRGTSHASDSLSSARAALRDGEVICIFPEGTISLTLLPMKAFSGVGRLALDSGVPVVPAGVWGTHRTYGKHHKRDIRHHMPVNVFFGEPLVFGPDSDKTAAEAADEIMAAVIRLVDEARSEYPEAPEPDDWWGPPEWPVEAAGRWRPKISKKMPKDEQQQVALEAMRAAAAEAGSGDAGVA